MTGVKGITAVPVVPLVSDSPGLKGFTITSRISLFAQSRTPAPVIERLNRELRDILAAPDLRNAMLGQGATPGSLSPADYATVLRSDLAQYEKVVKAAQIKAE